MPLKKYDKEEVLKQEEEAKKAEEEASTKLATTIEENSKAEVRHIQTRKSRILKPATMPAEQRSKKAGPELLRTGLRKTIEALICWRVRISS